MIRRGKCRENMQTFAQLPIIGTWLALAMDRVEEHLACFAESVRPCLGQTVGDGGAQS
jgi:hypothetical protein